MAKTPATAYRLPTLEQEQWRLPAEELERLPNRVPDVFKGRTVLVTGGSGFLGKVFVEKLLRCCPDVSRVYLLLRPKKGREPKQRLDDVFGSPLFDKLRSERPEALAKAVAVAGDVAAPDLGLSAADRRRLCQEVNVVLHAAATIRFDETLKRAVLLNTRGVKLMLQLAKEMVDLHAFLHVSTAYCHLKEKVLYERPYPPPADPHSIISLVENTPDDVLEAMTRKILGDLPNTYAFTKALGEGLVNEQLHKMPILILRPSVVIPIWKDPLPGWTDNINGPTGLLIGAGKGVIRTMYCNQKGYADFLPVDIAVNGIFVVAWNFLCNGDRKHNVVHMTSSSEYQVSWSDIIEIGRRVTERVPLNNVVWYPGGSMKRSRLLHYVCVLLFHLLPALLLDTIIFLSGNKPVLWRVHRRIIKGFEVFEYYANNQWDFKNDLVTDVRKALNARERTCFCIDGDDLDLEQYFEDCVKAARVYILKEMPETLPAARRHLKIMFWVDRITKIALGALLMWTLYTRGGAILEAVWATLTGLAWAMGGLVTALWALLSVPADHAQAPAPAPAPMAAGAAL